MRSAETLGSRGRGVLEAAEALSTPQIARGFEADLEAGTLACDVAEVPEG